VDKILTSLKEMTRVFFADISPTTCRKVNTSFETPVFMLIFDTLLLKVDNAAISSVVQLTRFFLFRRITI
jgi:hypothetical protein